jgi:glyoxylase-like metal-dependent hydrolase (beta-lactamase superfamily II)
MRRRATALLIIAACAAHADTQRPETLAERSQASARATLDRAVDSLGGAEALRSIEVVRLHLEGETRVRLQVPTPEPPFEAGTNKETLLLDLKNNRFRFEQHEVDTGFERNSTIVIKGGAGTRYNHRARTITPISAGQAHQQPILRSYRLPHLLLGHALERTNTLRSLGQDTFDGKPHEVFTFVMPDGEQVAVYVDTATGVVSKYELIVADPLTGEHASEIMFGDYTRAGAALMPRTLRTREAGDVTLLARLTVEINPPVTDQSFDVAAEGYARVNAPPDILEEKIEQLADGVFVIRNVAAQNMNTLAVAFKDYVLAVEAPGSSAGADAVIARIKTLIPGKPIRYVAVTHHHGDHIGGLRSYIAEGSTVITTPGNRKIVERLAAAPQRDRLAKHPRQLEFLFLQKGKRVLTDGSRTVELIDIGPHPHTREMVIAYLPKERLVFQGDLFIVPNNDAPPGPPQLTGIRFAEKLKALRLNVDRIAGVHGRTATIEEFNRVMKQPVPDS